MAYYTITYDLIAQKNYKRLIDALRSASAAAVDLSVWLLERHRTDPFELRDHFMKFIDDDDRLTVIEFEKCPAWRLALPEGRAWIEARFPT